MERKRKKIVIFALKLLFLKETNKKRWWDGKHQIFYKIYFYDKKYKCGVKDGGRIYTFIRTNKSI